VYLEFEDQPLTSSGKTIKEVTHAKKRREKGEEHKKKYIGTTISHKNKEIPKEK